MLWWQIALLVYHLYLWDSEDTTTTRAGAERRSTSCRHWMSRKWPKWQIWKVDSRPSSVRLHGCVQTAALHTRMCTGLLGGRWKIKHVWFFVDYKWNKEEIAAWKGNFYIIVGWGRGKKRQAAESKTEDVITRGGRDRKQGVLFQRVLDWRSLQRQSISNADMIQRFPVQLPMARQVLKIPNTAGWNPTATTHWKAISNRFNTRGRWKKRLLIQTLHNYSE